VLRHLSRHRRKHVTVASSWGKAGVSSPPGLDRRHNAGVARGAAWAGTAVLVPCLVLLRSAQGQYLSTFLKNHAQRVLTCDFLPFIDLFFRQI